MKSTPLSWFWEWNGKYFKDKLTLSWNSLDKGGCFQSSPGIFLDLLPCLGLNWATTNVDKNHRPEYCFIFKI